MKRSNILILAIVVAILSLNLYGSGWIVKKEMLSAKQLISIECFDSVSLQIKDTELDPSKISVSKADGCYYLEIGDHRYARSTEYVNGVLTSPPVDPLIEKIKPSGLDGRRIPIKTLAAVYLNGRLVWEEKLANSETSNTENHE